VIMFDHCRRQSSLCPWNSISFVSGWAHQIAQSAFAEPRFSGFVEDRKFPSVQMGLPGTDISSILHGTIPRQK